MRRARRLGTASYARAAKTALITALITFMCFGEAAAAKRPLRDFLGVMVDGPMITGKVDLVAEARLMADAGVGHARIAMYWRDIEPRPDEPPNWTTFDRMVGALAHRGIRVMPVLLRAPLWATNGDGREGAIPDTAAYARFAAAAVRRYGPGGTFWREHPQVPSRPIREWQIWNEPNIDMYWVVQPDWADSYVRLLRAARGAIKGVDPSARIVLAGLVGGPWWELDRIYRAGGAGAFDVVAIHPYRATPALVLRVVRETRRMMVAYGDAHMPMFVTEVTTLSTGGRVRPHELDTDEPGQAAWLARLMRRLMRYRHALGVERTYWFTWMSPPIGSSVIWDYGGLRRMEPDGRIVSKPALEALRRSFRSATATSARPS